MKLLKKPQKKSHMLRVLLVLTLSALLTACSGSINSSPTPSSSPSSGVKDGDTQSGTPNAGSILEAYKAVLQNNADFFSIDSNKSLKLNDFLTNKELYGTDFTVTRFAVLDMDGDTVPEVVLELSVGGYPEFYEILHYTKDAVNGYNIVYRGLEGLKADGSFYYSDSAADGGYGKLKFLPTALDTEILAYTQSSQSGGSTTLSYFIDSQSVTKEAYEAFTKEQDEKEDPVWQDFSEANVEAELSAKQ